jgi:hypothetical protein
VLKPGFFLHSSKYQKHLSAGQLKRNFFNWFSLVASNVWLFWELNIQDAPDFLIHSGRSGSGEKSIVQPTVWLFAWCDIPGMSAQLTTVWPRLCDPWKQPFFLQSPSTDHVLLLQPGNQNTFPVSGSIGSITVVEKSPFKVWCSQTGTLMYYLEDKECSSVKPSKQVPASILGKMTKWKAGCWPALTSNYCAVCTERTEVRRTRGTQWIPRKMFVSWHIVRQWTSLPQNGLSVILAFYFYFFWFKTFRPLALDPAQCPPAPCWSAWGSCPYSQSMWLCWVPSGCKRAGQSESPEIGKQALPDTLSHRIQQQISGRNWGVTFNVSFPGLWLQF